MKLNVHVCLFICCLLGVNAFGQIHLKYEENITPEYDEIIEMYRYLDQKYSTAKLIEAGFSDAGKPLHLFILSKDTLFSPEEIKASDKRIILINNGIHPGESNGIDASIEFAEDLLSSKEGRDKYLDNTVVLIVPVFNIGGALNRSPFNRANQNGPIEQGFRGNAQNLDLNRDFVKMDSKNAMSLAKIIQIWDPDIFIDTHSTNGADYPYTLTIIPSHHQQMEEPQSRFLRTLMEPALFDAMNKSPYKMSPYVNLFRQSPKNGFKGFYEYPRYLAGYTSSFHILSFTVETHMLKPYKERVKGTKLLLEEILKFTDKHSALIKDNKSKAIKLSIDKKLHVLQWYNDTTQSDIIEFSGYAAKTRISQVTGQEMLYYDREDQWTAYIPFYNYFKANIEIEVPNYYIIPAAWSKVIERLKCSKIEMHQFQKDTSLNVDCYYIENYQTTKTPYNGHYMHFATQVKSEMQALKFQKGDYIIPVRQRGINYLVHTLEPQAYDSYFNWNFFDAVLMRNEYFSPYLFDKTAFRILNENPDLKKQFLEKQKTDSDFSSSPYAQLRWIYEKSKWSEKSYMRYPVYRFDGESVRDFFNN